MKTPDSLPPWVGHGPFIDWNILALSNCRALLAWANDRSEITKLSYSFALFSADLQGPSVISRRSIPAGKLSRASRQHDLHRRNDRGERCSGLLARSSK